MVTEIPSLKLLLASIWLPGPVIRSELDRIAAQTTEALCSLLREKAPNDHEEVSSKIRPLSGSIEERRAVMASNHRVLVEALSNGIGFDGAVDVGREALFMVGVRLGEESRVRLGVGDSIRDLLLAARVLYRVLEISFTAERDGQRIRIVVERCALSCYYSELACIVLSAVDEGVVRGLNPNVAMRFEKRKTAGSPTCVARVNTQAGERRS